MADPTPGLVTQAIRSQEQGLAWLEKMVALARPEAVFGEPVTSGDYTVITASEAWAGMGFGFGAGGGTGPTPGDDGQGTTEGGGGGGGGVSTGRPVAVVAIGPGGVRVEQVVDATKIALAFLSVLGGLFVMWGRMQRRARR